MDVALRWVLFPLHREGLHLLDVVHLCEGDLVRRGVLANEHATEDEVGADFPMAKAELRADLLDLYRERPLLVSTSDDIIHV